MKLASDNKTGMFICNALMVRSDITEEEKRFVTRVQREILAAPIGYKPIGTDFERLMELWWRGKDKPTPKPKFVGVPVKAEVVLAQILGDYGYQSGIEVRCTRCGFEVEVFGTGTASARRGALMLRQRCPYNEKNFYDVSDWRKVA